MTRPDRIAVVVGTATEIGKTWVSAQLATAARRRGFKVAARKPAQSFERGEGPTDADVLGTATGETPTTVCPEQWWLPVPMAPPMAAEVLGIPAPTTAQLVESITWPDTTVHLGLVETVGGLRSPMGADGDSRDLLRAVEPDAVILVAHAGLGTINDCLLAVEALQPLRPVIVLNHFDRGDDLHQRNRAWLTEREGLAAHAVSGPVWTDRLLGDAMRR